MNVKGITIFVGLSGGVDSAVSAALLKQAGALVTGVFIKGWYPPGMPCTWAAERRDAMRVAARLRIPFLTLDASAEYKKSVIEYLLAEYQTGRTPNPDVMCNKEVKFGVFYRFAKDAGAAAIATGHYRSGEKDQSYFLWAVPKDILNAAIFPVRNMAKSDVRELAEKFNLPVSRKKDSQGVCFLGSVSVKEFLEKELGSDNPALFYTLGQRVGSDGLPSEASAKEGPWYVVAKDVDKKKIEVSKTRMPIVRTISFAEANWFDDPGHATEAQYRYRGPRMKGRIENGRFACTEENLEIPTPGQSIVFYHRDKLHTRFWIASAIIALAIILGFVLSVPHTRDLPQEVAPEAAAPEVPSVTLRDAYKKGLHTITGSLMAPNACASATATAQIEGNASSTERIVINITLSTDTNLCLQLPTRVSFSASIAAPPRLPLSSTVNGRAASTTAP